MLERDGGRVAAAHLLGGGADVRHGGGEGGDELDEHVVEVGEGEVATIELGQLDGVHGHAVGLVVLACPALAAALGNEAVEGLAAVEVGASDHDHVARGHLVPQFLLQQRPGHLAAGLAVHCGRARLMAQRPRAVEQAGVHNLRLRLAPRAAVEDEVIHAPARLDQPVREVAHGVEVQVLARQLHHRLPGLPLARPQRRVQHEGRAAGELDGGAAQVQSAVGVRRVVGRHYLEDVVGRDPPVHRLVQPLGDLHPVGAGAGAGLEDEGGGDEQVLHRRQQPVLLFRGEQAKTSRRVELHPGLADLLWRDHRVGEVEKLGHGLGAKIRIRLV
mmetsp:Transcript_19206/g.53050  ORF Transcript_19206/g.53050 Transcript_19206/m.53050 type:complete len:330 (+) Transcript_19206:611-1600(+)